MKSIFTLAGMLLLANLTVMAQITPGTTTQQRGTLRVFDALGVDKNGATTKFSSMIRNKFVNLPHLTYTIKKSGTYLVLLGAVGSGVQEKNNIYAHNDDRTDLEGQIRLSPSDNAGGWYLVKKFFYTHVDANDPTQDATEHMHSDDGEKSLIKYFKQGEVIHVNVYVEQKNGSAASVQKSPWNIAAQVKYILLD